MRLALEKEKRERCELIAHLKQHVETLAADSLQGRRTGSPGELMAMNYLVNQYKHIGLLPANGNDYIQEFEYDEGKTYKLPATFLKINDKPLVQEEDYFPLAFSASNNVTSNTAVALKEPNEIWFYDVKDALEENQQNPHFDIEDHIKKIVVKFSGSGAKAIILYNSSSVTDNISFNKKDKSAAINIPVVYLSSSAYKKYFTDAEAINKINISVTFHQQIRKVRNVLGFINNNATHTVILGAHYDHLGLGEDKNALDTFKNIHNGADDNASGSAALLELARLLKQTNCTNNNYLVMHFSGEELGLIGSKHWLENRTINISTNYMLNMDMVGRYDTAHKLTIGGYGTSPVWGEVLPGITSSIITKYDSTGSGPSDHAAFYRKDIPVLFFFTGSHSDYHKISDDFEKINYEGEADILKLILKIIDNTNSKGKLAFTKTAEPAMGKSSRFTVSLGVIPDYGFSGTGVRIDGVSPGKIAERVGLQAGDILLQLGEYKFTDVMSYMQTLSKFKKEDKTKLTIKRKDVEMVFDIVF